MKKIIIFSIVTLLMLGFVYPYLISHKSYELPILGCLILSLNGYWGYVTFKNHFKF